MPVREGDGCRSGGRRKRRGSREREKNRSVVGDVTLTTTRWAEVGQRGGARKRGEGEVERLSMMSLTTLQAVPGGDARKGVRDLGEGEEGGGVSGTRKGVEHKHRYS